MSALRFAIIGTGFWARFQLAAWQELEGVACVALCNRTKSKAAALAAAFGVPTVYDDAAQMFRAEQLDFVDIITDVDTHERFVQLAAEHGVTAICQKPMGPDLVTARRMVETCRTAGVAFHVHENWRWQTPLRALNEVLDSGVIGTMFRGRIQYSSSFPVFDNQPFLKELDQFILTDIGSHILDVARFLFGEASRLYCQTYRVHEDIKGEDVATVMMTMSDNMKVNCEMSYASRLEHERFPEAYVLVEGSRGSVELCPDFWLRVTTADGTHSRRVVPPMYDWSIPAYALVHSSIVNCNADLLRAIQTGGLPETNAADNLKTCELYYGAYESAATGQAITLNH